MAHITQHQKKKSKDLNRFFSKEDMQMGQYVHEKIFNMANHQGNANQNYNEISLLICQNDYLQKTTQKIQ